MGSLVSINSDHQTLLLYEFKGIHTEVELQTLSFSTIWIKVCFIVLLFSSPEFPVSTVVLGWRNVTPEDFPPPKIQNVGKRKESYLKHYMKSSTKHFIILIWTVIILDYCRLCTFSSWKIVGFVTVALQPVGTSYIMDMD